MESHQMLEVLKGGVWALGILAGAMCSLFAIATLSTLLWNLCVAVWAWIRGVRLGKDRLGGRSAPLSEVSDSNVPVVRNITLGGESPEPVSDLTQLEQLMAAHAQSEIALAQTRSLLYKLHESVATRSLSSPLSPPISFTPIISRRKRPRT